MSFAFSSHLFPFRVSAARVNITDGLIGKRNSPGPSKWFIIRTLRLSKHCISTTNATFNARKKSHFRENIKRRLASASSLSTERINTRLNSTTKGFEGRRLRSRRGSSIMSCSIFIPRYFLFDRLSIFVLWNIHYSNLRNFLVVESNTAILPSLVVRFSSLGLEPPAPLEEPFIDSLTSCPGW